MSKPTSIRLDDTTRTRAAAIQARAVVPVTVSAVLQEAIRRGLEDLEREGAPSTPGIINCYEGFNVRAEVCTSNGHYRVDVYKRESATTWGLVSFESSASLGWCEKYAQCVVLGTVQLSGVMDRKPKGL